MGNMALIATKSMLEKIGHRDLITTKSMLEKIGHRDLITNKSMLEKIGQQGPYHKQIYARKNWPTGTLSQTNLC